MNTYTATTYTIEGTHRIVSSVIQQERKHLGREFIDSVISWMRIEQDYMGQHPTGIYADITRNGDEIVAHICGFLWIDANGRKRRSWELWDDTTMLRCTTHSEVIA